MKEYYTLKEVASNSNLTYKKAQQILTQLVTKYKPPLLFKTLSKEWRIHHLLLPKFKLKSKTINETDIALTVDFGINMSELDVHAFMRVFLLALENKQCKMDYSMEYKKKNNRIHVHALLENTTLHNVSKTASSLFLGFSYRIKVVFDKKGWRKYITKESESIHLNKNLLKSFINR